MTNSEDLSDVELLLRERSQLEGEAREYVLQAMTPEERLLIIADPRDPAALEAVANKYTKLYIENHLDALVWAKLYTRSLNSDGQECYEPVGDSMPPQTVIDMALKAYRRWQTD